MLTSRFKAIQKRVLDGNDRVSRYLELIPLDEVRSSLGLEDEELAGRIEAAAAKRAKLLAAGRWGVGLVEDSGPSADEARIARKVRGGVRVSPLSREAASRDKGLGAGDGGGRGRSPSAAVAAVGASGEKLNAVAGTPKPGNGHPVGAHDGEKLSSAGAIMRAQNLKRDGEKRAVCKKRIQTLLRCNLPH